MIFSGKPDRPSKIDNKKINKNKSIYWYKRYRLRYSKRKCESIDLNLNTVLYEYNGNTTLN